MCFAAYSAVHPSRMNERAFGLRDVQVLVPRQHAHRVARVIWSYDNLALAEKETLGHIP